MATISLLEPTPSHAPGGFVLFASGFRPFFLLAALQALVAVPVWLAINGGLVDLPSAIPAVIWHGHEMVFGFAGAAIGGFLLTAVPGWTNSEAVGGFRLMALVALWLAGRIAFALNGLLPIGLVAALELAYLPLLAATLAVPLIRAGKARNIAFLPLLALLWLCDGAVLLGFNEGVRAAIVVVLVMITVVAGRIVPSFTANWLRLEGRLVEIRSFGWIEKGGAAASVAVAGVLSILLPDSAMTGVIFLIAAVLHAVRLSRWHGAKALANPLLWSLHLGYLWLVVGLALMGLARFVPALPESAALHALTAGCAGTMVIAVMSRAALGHSGRPLRASKMVVAAYVLVTVGAALRVAAPLWPEAMAALITLGGSLWASAWLLFTVVHLPIMVSPRADGRPG